jgi:5-dehydro-2-deoxygluconokinase
VNHLTAPAQLDVITIGRSSVDLYGQQVGGRLEDMASFSKAVGGCPANIAIGAARLGLKAGLITRVGNEAMGRFILEQMQREGVATQGIALDAQRLTALVILGVRDDKTFPLIFVRENCADAALDESDIIESYIASAKAIVVSGTHFARPNTDAAQRKAMRFAKAHGRKIAFDIDYRPNLWGLAGHDAGEARYIRADDVTRHLESILPECDLIVGTEEEFHIAGGSQDTVQALRNVRMRSRALLVCKRGPMGCVVFPGAIPASLEQGIKGPGFPVDVYNVLGAGDAFMAGFLRGWLRDEPLVTCCSFANACGAFAVSRLLCSVEYPTWPELQYFLTKGSRERMVRHDETLNRIHWSTTRRPQPETLRILSIDHRVPLLQMARELNLDADRIAAFKLLVMEAAARVGKGREGYGMFLDGGAGRKALHAALDRNLWLARPIDKPHTRPLDFEGSGSLGAELAEWPVTQSVKCALYAHPDENEDFWGLTERALLRLNHACRARGLELLIETLSSPHGEVEHDTTARVMRRIYGLGINPDWWVVEPQVEARAWTATGDAVRHNDPYCRGILTIAREIEGFASIAGLARQEPLVKGFCAGRSIFGSSLAPWLKEEIGDVAAIDTMAQRFQNVVDAWDGAKT